MLNIHSIKLKFIVLVSLLLITAVSARLLIGIPFLRDHVVQQIVAQEQSLADYAAQDIARSIQTRLASITEMAADLPPGMLHRPDQLSAWLKARQRANPLFSGLWVIRADGHALLAAYPPLNGSTAADFSQTDWFRLAKAHPQTVLGQPARWNRTGPALLPAAMPLLDAQGKRLAMLVGVSRLDAPGFLDGLRQSRPGPHGAFLLVAPREHLLLAGSDPARILTATPPPGVDLLYDHALTGFSDGNIMPDQLGEEQIATQAPVPGTDWNLIVTIPTAEALRAVDAFRRLSIRGSALMLLLLIAGIALFLAMVLVPLSKAARAMRDMANGKKALARLPVQRKDEVGDLLRGFNHLVAKLHEKERTLHETLKTLDQLASTDPLTGAWNRRLFNELAASEHERATRHGHPLTIMLLDLDLFKQVNDTYGHAEGDRVLQHVAGCIRTTLRKSDSLARWGGEEFMILMPDTTQEQAIVLAERVRVNIATQHNQGMQHVTASIGVAAFQEQEPLEQWIARADAAMYLAKSLGRNRVEVDRSVPDQSPPAPAEKPDATLLRWSEQFHSGNPKLDAQHQTLFDYSNQLLAAIHSGQGDERVSIVLECLLNGIVQHYQEEEQLMQRIAYPYSQEHRAQHSAMLQQAFDMVQQFQDARLEITDLARFLMHDLVAKHIQDEDRDFYAYLNSASACY